jgi:uncharacterized protein with FMN-binding domain
MKRSIISALAAAAAIILTASTVHQDVQTKKVLGDGTIVINTTEIGKSFTGFMDITPLEVSIKGGKVVKVTPLENTETPAYFAKLVDAKFFDSWNGLTPDKALAKEVDAVSGATFSSKAVIGNVQEAMKYIIANPK